MPSFVVVAGADVEMADLEGGNGISARIDLNLHLAPPTNADFLRLGSGPASEEGQVVGQEHSQRRILPRFGPGIHGVFLDLHQESESSEARSRASVSAVRASTLVGGDAVSSAGEEVQQRGFLYHTSTSAGDVIAESLEPSQVMRAPMRHHRIRRYPRPASVVRIGGRRLDVGSVRNQVLDRGAKDKDPARETEEAKEAVKSVGSGDNFECNVCLDLAVEPVVTVCGHLFCWHCLYQWLYVHSDNEECPVCKGSVGDGSIIPIYGRGSSSSVPVQRQASPTTVAPSSSPSGEGGAAAAAAAEVRESSVPPRPHARRVESLRQRLEAAGREEWERAMSFEDGEQGDGRRAFWHLNEVLRMRRAIRFLQDSIPARTRVLRRRMSERREHYRSPAVRSQSQQQQLQQQPPQQHQQPPQQQQQHVQGSSNEALDRAVGELEARAAFLQDDYARELAASRAETEDRVAVIRARLAHLVDTIESHRRQAASMVASLEDPGVTVVVTQPATRAGTSSSSRRAAVATVTSAAGTTSSTLTSTPQGGNSSSTNVVVEGPSSSSAAAMDEAGGAAAEAAGEASGDVEDDDPELLHTRKRRRLN